MAIKDTKKDLKLGMTVAEAVKNADDNFTTLFDNDDDLQTQINGKEPKITTKNSAFNKNFSTANPQMDGTASPGTADNVARGDHKHPTDTTRLAAAPDGKTNLLDSNNKINSTYLPDEVLGQLSYKGVWDASTSTGAPATTKQKGDYYVCSKGGKYSPDGTTAVSTYGSYAVGDWAVYNGVVWDKVDNTDAVTMVNGQIGSVETYKGAYSSTTVYHKGDIVLGTDSCLYLFINSTAANGKELTDTTAWKIFGKVYSNATTSAAGLMSATDKTNLDQNTAARHSHTNKAFLDSYDQTNDNIKDAVSKKHSHSNKNILDATTASYTTEEKNKLAAIDDSWGKVKDVYLDGKTVVDTNGIAQLKSPYHIAVTTSDAISNDAFNALLNDRNSYVTYEGRIYRRVDNTASPTPGSQLKFVCPTNDIIYQIVITGSTLLPLASQIKAESTSNKSTTIDANSDTKYPTTKAVANHVSAAKTAIEAEIKVTDVQKPNGTSIVTNKIAKLPNINLTVSTASYNSTSSGWVQKTINGQICYGVTVPSGFKAMVNANGEELLCQLIYDSTTKKFTAYIAEKQAITILSESPTYA